MKRDLANNLKNSAFLKITTTTAGAKTAYSSAVDTADMKSVVFAGALIDNTDGSVYEPSDQDSIAITVQESEAPGSGFADVDDSLKQIGGGAITDSLFKVGAVSTKRYIRFKVVVDLYTLGNGELNLDGAVLGEQYVRPVE